MNLERPLRSTRLPPAMRYPLYRAYWFGTLVSVGGFQIFQFTQFLLVFHLTGSPLHLGLVGLANAVPAISLVLVGGVVADKVDRRKLLVTTQLTTAALILTLGALTLSGGVQVWHVWVLAFATGAVAAFDGPARQAIYPALLDRAALSSGVALNSAIWQGMRIGGPAIAGNIVAYVGGAEKTGLAVALFIASGGFFLMGIIIFAMLPSSKPEADGPTRALGDLMDGLRYIRGNGIVAFLVGMSYFNSMFGSAYIALMPIFALEILGVGADLQGWLFSGAGVGGLTVTLLMGSRRELPHRSALIIGGAAVYGTLIAAFAMTTDLVGSYLLSLLIMVGIGATLSTFMVPLETSIQMTIPDQMRGRAMGLFTLTYSLQPLSAMQAGFLATFVGVPVAVAIGGGLVTLFALGPALLNPKIRHINAELRRQSGGIAVP